MENSEEVVEEQQEPLQEKVSVADVEMENQDTVTEKAPEMATESGNTQNDGLLNLEADRIEDEEIPTEVDQEVPNEVDETLQEDAVQVPEEEESVKVDENPEIVVVVTNQPELQECPEAKEEPLEKIDLVQPEEVKSPLVIVNELWNQPRRSTVKMPDPSQLEKSAPPTGPFLHKCPYDCGRQFEMRSNMIRHIKYKWTYLPKIKSISATLHFPADKKPECCSPRSY